MVTPRDDSCGGERDLPPLPPPTPGARAVGPGQEQASKPLRRAPILRLLYWLYVYITNQVRSKLHALMDLVGYLLLIQVAQHMIPCAHYRTDPEDYGQVSARARARPPPFAELHPPAVPSTRMRRGVCHCPCMARLRGWLRG